MAPPIQALTVVYSATALRELDKIWDYNADFYESREHATEYVGFLKAEIKTLSTEYLEGREVATNDKLRYIVMKRSTQGHGHIAVYRITSAAVRIVHIFHTAQDWENKVKPRRS